ncbi:NAD(P)H-quinone oxidoreductase [Phaeovibrio sulfidiphilus]|uniref:NAD(P)H-quinone oxidoreductase n=1 Tax=Phaeovibrio sulfidiphilus TaxID=1220600 RepID=A0A8J6YLW0_9PROT|nr:NAD(P)H-quinone oxidoreductase [Phaeovibrio sulfidiphilus]MBE1236800.1 NAD(P)H-quinone oxidoreductase [Phaeovibrio sulfidiphilus]
MPQSSNSPLPLPETMACIEIDGKGGPEVLKPARRPVPVPGEGEVLIRIRAAGVNGPDLVQRQGYYPPPPGASDLPGLEVSGVIAALGPGAGEGLRVGMPVCALLTGGGYAEYATADGAVCLPVPGDLSFAEAAALPETTFTVWRNVFQIGDLREGDRFLVHGGASGIGTTAIQLAKAFGATVYTTAGSPEKCALCERLGAERAINYREEVYEDVIRELVGKAGVDVILDMVGGDYVARDISIMAEGGTRVSIAFKKGSKVSFDMMRVMLKRLTLTGSTLRTQPVGVKAAIASKLRRHVWPLVESGRFRPHIYRELPLAEAAEAHRLMEASEHSGKVVLVL